MASYIQSFLSGASFNADEFSSDLSDFLGNDYLFIAKKEIQIKDPIDGDVVLSGTEYCYRCEVNNLYFSFIVSDIEYQVCVSGPIDVKPFDFEYADHFDGIQHAINDLLSAYSLSKKNDFSILALSSLRVVDLSDSREHAIL